MSAPSESTVRVRYAETDQMGFVHHANYLVYFEIGRTELLRASGYDGPIGLEYYPQTASAASVAYIRELAATAVGKTW